MCQQQSKIIFCQQKFYSKINKLFMDYLFQKRKEQRKFIRLKIVTNRNLNFITAIRADSTVTDLANRALNVYLQLANQFGSKKQLTVSAVKQGRYFMPKSEYVSNLLGQDQEVEVIIVKAKPKFPNQTIPTTQHSFAQYTRHIKQFSQQKTKLPKSLLIQGLKKQHQKQKHQSEISSSKSQLQQSKRDRKKNKKNQKGQKNKIQQSATQQKADQVSSKQKAVNEQVLSKSKLSENKLKNIKDSSKDFSIILNNVSQSSINNHINKEESQLQKNQSSPVNLQIPITAFRKKSVEQQIEKFQLQILKKKVKTDLNQSQSKSKVKIDQPQSQTKIPNKEKQQRSKQKSLPPNVNLPISIQSPKITFHTEKLQSPKVIYLNDPIRKSSNDLKVSLQKEKERLKSPALLAKSSPKITYSEPTYSKQLLSKINEAVGMTSKKKQQKSNIDLSQIQISVSSPRLKSTEQKNSFKRESTISQKQKKETETSKKTQPQIIQEESSENQQYVQFKGKRNLELIYSSQQSQSSSDNSKKSQKHRNREQNLNKQPSSKSSTKDKFYQIQMKMKKFKLQDSSDEE